MKNRRLVKYMMFLLAVTGMWFSVFHVSAETDVSEKAASEARLSDSAGLLTTEESVKLSETLGRVPENYDLSVYLITTAKIGKKESTSYMKEQYQKAEDKNLIICLISTKGKKVFCTVQAFGSAKEHLTEKRLKKLASDLEKQMENKKYLGGMEFFCRDLLEKLQSPPVFDMIFFRPFFDFILCLVLTVIGMVLYLGDFSKKGEEEKISFYDAEHSILLESKDVYTHTSSKSLKQKRKQEEEFSELDED